MSTYFLNNNTIKSIVLNASLSEPEAVILGQLQVGYGNPHFNEFIFILLSNVLNRATDISAEHLMSFDYEEESPYCEGMDLLMGVIADVVTESTMPEAQYIDICSLHMKVIDILGKIVNYIFPVRGLHVKYSLGWNNGGLFSWRVF